MGENVNPSARNAYMSIIGGAVLLLLGYVISNMGDRYRASEAERDFRKIRGEIALSEQRVKELLIEHRTGGPHDDVAVRLVIIETNYKAILSELKDIKSYIRSLNDTEQ